MPATMTKPVSPPQPNQRFIDPHGSALTVTLVRFNRVTFFRDGYEHPCSQSVERFMREFKELAQ